MEAQSETQTRRCEEGGGTMWGLDEGEEEDGAKDDLVPPTNERIKFFFSKRLTPLSSDPILPLVGSVAICLYLCPGTLRRDRIRQKIYFPVQFVKK